MALAWAASAPSPSATAAPWTSRRDELKQKPKDVAKDFLIKNQLIKE